MSLLPDRAWVYSKGKRQLRSIAIKQLVESDAGTAPNEDAKLMVMAQSQARLCSVFANPKRIRILWSLAEGEKPVTAIAQAIGASLQCTSQHLSLMKTTGVLEARREGQTIYYRVSEEFMEEGCQVMLEKRREL